MSEKMKKCKACGNEIAKSAKTCPHCGAKNKKKHPVLIGIIVVVALIVVIAAMGDGDESGKNTKTEFCVGEAAELDGVSVTLVNVSESTGSQFNTPTEGNVFVICEFEIENNSDDEVVVSSIMSFDAYCDDYTCTYSLSALLEKDDKNQLDGTVAAGKKFNGVIGYEVPADWSDLEIRFTPDFWDGKEIIFVATK